MGSGFKDWAAGDILTANDVDGYLMRQTVMTFADASARDSALSGVLDEGMCAYLEDTNEITVYDGSAWIIYAGRGYQYVQTVYFTSSGTFTKATYPWLRAIRVKIVGGGGGGSGVAATAGRHGSGGGGGGYGESFITDIAGLDASVTVTVGAGGAGGASGANNGSNGGTSEFGSLSATGGGGGQQPDASTLVSAGAGGSGVGCDLNTSGGGGGAASRTLGDGAGAGGSSMLGGGGFGQSRFGSNASTGAGGAGYGGGGSGATTGANVASSGGNGAAGIVIVELYA